MIAKKEKVRPLVVRTDVHAVRSENGLVHVLGKCEVGGVFGPSMVYFVETVHNAKTGNIVSEESFESPESVRKIAYRCGPFNYLHNPHSLERDEFMNRLRTAEYELSVYKDSVRAFEEVNLRDLEARTTSR